MLSAPGTRAVAAGMDPREGRHWVCVSFLWQVGRCLQMEEAAKEKWETEVKIIGRHMEGSAWGWTTTSL